MTSTGPSTHEIAFDLSGIGVVLTGLNAELCERLRRDWLRFVDPHGASPLLRVDLEIYDRAPAKLADYRPKAMESSFAADAAEYRMPEGSARVDAAGRARIRLAPELGNREYFTMHNLLRACLAWSLPRRPATLVHAAGLEVGGNAFLLVGAEGTGKSTWVGLGEQAGARPLSDDLVLVDGFNGRTEVLGAPFRSTHAADYRPGRWPLAAVLLPRFARETRWIPVPRLLGSARLTANLPFIAEAGEESIAIASIVERLFGSIACLELSYPRAPSFLELLREWPESAP